MKNIIFIFLIIGTLFSLKAEAKKKPFGNGLYWELTKDGTLLISGKGEMPNRSPWINKSSKIEKVIIEKGVLSIGGAAFQGNKKKTYSHLKSITIPNSVTSINYCAFENCI